MASGVIFPYRNMTEAERDRFAKLGGTANAFRLLAYGFREEVWHKRGYARARAREREEDAAFLAQNKGRTGFARLSRGPKED